MTSKILKEIQNEERTREPSLDQMVDLKDPKVLKGLGKIAQAALDRRSNKEQEPEDVGQSSHNVNAEKARRSKAYQKLKARQDRSPASMPLSGSTPQTTV